MNDENPKPPAIDVEMPALEKQLLSLASIVENAFADAIVALIESDADAAHDAQREDYKAHQVWLQADSMALDLLSSGELDLHQVQFVSAGMKIALNLKVMADEGTRISHLMKACPSSGKLPSSCTELLPEMAEMAQTMFGDSVDAFVNQNAKEAESQDLVFRELSSLHEQLTDRVNTELSNQENLAPQVATSLILVGRSLEIIGERSLDIANHVVRLYSEESDQHLEDLEAEAE